MLSVKRLRHYFRIYRGHFIYSDHLLGALRITLSIALAVLVGWCCWGRQAGVEMGVGAIMLNLVDAPGLLWERIITALRLCLVIAFVTTTTSLLVNYPVLLGGLVVAYGFVFSLFDRFGKQYGLIGAIALVIMAFVIGLKPVHPLLLSSHMIAGGVIATLIMALHLTLFQRLPVRNAVSETAFELAALLRSKAQFYDGTISVEDAFLNFLPRQLQTNQRIELMRHLVLGDHRFPLLQPATDLIDCYEQVIAIADDYDAVRAALTDKQLSQLRKLANVISDELEQLSLKLLYPSRKPSQDFEQRVEMLLMALVEEASQPVLKELYQNIQLITTLVQKIGTESLFNNKVNSLEVERLRDVALPVRWSLKNIFDSSAPGFRFAVRMACTLLFAYIIAVFKTPAAYNYWILLTIVVVVRPSFSLTQSRNTERLAGTLCGLLVATALLLLPAPAWLRVFVLALGLTGYFAFLRISYLASVFSVTLFVLLALQHLTGEPTLVWQRLVNTLIGCSICFAAPYLYPAWEKKQLKSVLNQLHEAQSAYLRVVHSHFSEELNDLIAYKAARKLIFKANGDLAGFISRMTNEPRSQQVDMSLLHQLQVTAYRIYALPAALVHNQAVANEGNMERRLQQLDALTERFNYLAAQLSKEN